MLGSSVLSKSEKEAENTSKGLKQQGELLILISYLHSSCRQRQAKYK